MPWPNSTSAIGITNIISNVISTRIIYYELRRLKVESRFYPPSLHQSKREGVRGMESGISRGRYEGGGWEKMRTGNGGRRGENKKEEQKNPS